MENPTHQIASLVLAAGSSKRMGRAKLILKYQGISLIEKCIRSVQAIKNNPVYVVTGAYREEIMHALSDYEGIQFIHNPKHLEGMGSSIACGIREISQKNYKGVLLVLPDQILVETKYFEELLEIGRAKKDHVILSDYGETSGPPTFFPSEVFPLLLKLSGDKGAKHGLLKHFPHTSVEFPFGIVDIDDPEDCKKYDISD